MARPGQATVALLLERVRIHFRSVIVQEKGRVACFDFDISTVTPEHVVPLAAEIEQPIETGDVVNLGERVATRGVLLGASVCQSW